MHESALMAELVRAAESAARKEGAARVTRVRLRLGGLSDIGEAGLRDHFSEAVAGTMLEGAALDVERGPTGDEAFSDPDARGVLLVGLELDLSGGEPAPRERGPEGPPLGDG